MHTADAPRPGGLIARLQLMMARGNNHDRGLHTPRRMSSGESLFEDSSV